MNKFKNPKAVLTGVLAVAAMALSVAGTAKPAAAQYGRWDVDIRVSNNDRYYGRDDYRYRRDDRWRDSRWDNRRCDDDRRWRNSRWDNRRWDNRGRGWGRDRCR